MASNRDNRGLDLCFAHFAFCAPDTLGFCRVAAALGGVQPGDPSRLAPPRIAEWARGSPVDLAAGKGRTIFVIEFWATWCSPCVDSIPHLSGLQQKFKERGVAVVGVTDETRAERALRRPQGAHSPVDGEWAGALPQFMSLTPMFLPIQARPSPSQ